MLCHCVKMQNARAEQSSPGSACQSEPQLVYSNSQARHRHTLLSALSWFPINVYGWLVFRTDARGEGYTQQGEQILALQMYQRIVSRSKSWGQKNQAAVRYCVLCHNMVVKGEWRHLLSHSYLISVVHALEIWTSFFVCFCIKQTKHNTNKKKNLQLMFKSCEPMTEQQLPAVRGLCTLKQLFKSGRNDLLQRSDLGENGIAGSPICCRTRR